MGGYGMTTKEKIVKYPAVIDGERGVYGVVIPDLRGAYAMGATVDEALADAEDMLPEILDVLRENGAPIPAPRAAEDVELRPGEMLAFVTLRTPTLVK